MKRVLLLSYFIYGLGALSVAQNSLKGHIMTQNESIIGATVKIEGSNLGTVSDFNGDFNITKIPDGSYKVRVSFVGYHTEYKTISFTGNSLEVWNLSLEEDNQLMNEVVVVAYGTENKKAGIGSVASLKSDKLNDNVGGTLISELQGKTPGVLMTSSSGAAGAAGIVRLRGTNSITAGGDPLYVIDGVPLSNENFLNGERGGQNNNPLSSINPADIESISFLKDASSAAIYGSRGANGVILITTKRGGKKRFGISYSASIGNSKPTHVIDLMNKEQWFQVQQEAFENDGGVGRFQLPLGLSYDDVANINTDWMRKVIQTGMKMEHNLGITIGGNKLKAYLGGTISKAESFLVGNFFERYSGRINLDYTPVRWFKLGISSSAIRGLNKRAFQAWAGGLGLAQSNALMIYPIFKNEFPKTSPFYDSVGYFNINQNPVAQQEHIDFRTREWRYINSVSASFFPTARLSFNINGGADISRLGDFTYEDAIWTRDKDISKINLSNVDNYNIYATSQYQIPLRNSAHELTILAGLEYQDFKVTGYDQSYNYIADLIYNVDSIWSDVKEYASKYYVDRDGYKFASAFSRLNYSWNQKLFAQATFRRDASSKFGPNNRFGNFPSIGVGYVISDDHWFKNNIINYLKIKTSFGITGNSNIPWSQQYETYKLNNSPLINYDTRYNNENTRFQEKVGNPNLKWEEVQKVDVGLDFGLWKDRISGSLTYFYDLTKDALLLVALQSSTGLENLNFYDNVGKIQNKGIEFSLTSHNLVGAFKWTTEFNITAIKNKVLEVGTATPDALDGGFGDIRVVVNYPVGVNYIVRFSHVDKATGRPVYLDKNGKETFTYNVAEDRVPAGTLQADFYGGLTNTFSYKNWSLSALLFFKYGGKLYDDAAKRQLGVVTTDWNMRPLIFDRWQQEGDQSRYPRFTNTMLNWGGNDNAWQNNHSLWLYDASYMRLRNVTVAYTIKGKTAKSISYRFYITGNNILTFTKYPGWDPEVARDRTTDQQRNVGGFGVSYLTAPQEKSWVFGVNVDF
ncbi:MAG: SusC/RagA family TonB-linked outer membrane protein [Saprospiraceae bacterium]|nr:SusC/RagA family TonB-linked outer membrane protein [Saprospiraceae bacterium]